MPSLFSKLADFRLARGRPTNTEHTYGTEHIRVHNYFPEIPETDHVIADYECTRRNTLIRGRLFITANHVSFLGRLLVENMVWVNGKLIPDPKKRPDLFQFQLLCIPISEIASLEKNEAEFIIQESLQIITYQATYTFTSFLSPATTFDVISRTVRLDDRERISSQQPTDLGSIFGLQPKKTLCACSNDGQHYLNTVLDVVLPGTPDKIHELIFASWFIKEFYTENQGLHVLKVSEWSQTSTELLARDVEYYRYIPTNSGKSRDVLCSLRDEIVHKDLDVYIATVTTTRTNLNDVGAEFYVKTRTCVMWASSSATRVVVTTQVEWNQRRVSAKIKNRVTEAAIDGQKTYYADLEEAMRAYIHKRPYKFIPNDVNPESSVEENQLPVVVAHDNSSDEGDADSSDQHDLDSVMGSVVASSKRNSDFHELFPSIPKTDYLLEDYGCALQREILFQGRLYVSENHICFYANVFGWITDLSIPITEIESLEKKTTVLVIPDAIEITTRQAKYIFAAFLSRNTTFDVIYNIWKLVRPNADSVSLRASIDVSTEPSTAVISGIKPRKTQCACSKDGSHFSEMALDTVIPGTPDRIHNLIFMSGFIEEFLSVNQKFLDIQISDKAPTSPTSKLLVWNISYIKPLNASVGPTKCEIKNETVHLDFEEYVSTITTMRTPDVPSGGVFAVMTRTCIMWASAVSTRVIVTTQIDWSGGSFIKGIIERSAIEGQKAYHADLEKAMRAYIQGHQSEFIPDDSSLLTTPSSPLPPLTTTPSTTSRGSSLSTEPQIGTDETSGSPRGSIDVSTDGGGGPTTAVTADIESKRTQCACFTDGSHFSETVLDTVVPGTPDRIHNLIYTGGFINKFFSIDQKFYDIQISDWTPTSPTSKLLTRTMSYIKPRNSSIAPKQTKCEIKDETVHLDFEEYVSTITTMRTPDVPSGGVFAVMTRTCIMWASAVSARVVVTAQVDWSGKSLIKGIIERSEIEGQNAYYADLEKAMRAYIQEHQSEFIPKRTQCACFTDGSHFSETVLDTVVPGTPDRIHDLIFMSAFIKEYFSVYQKFFDIQISDWTPTSPTSKLLTRNMSYIKPLNSSIGPKQTKCEIKDETVHLDFEEYVSTITMMRTPDVPSGGVFVVMRRTCVMWASAASTRVVVTAQVDWSGRSFIKGIIERSAIEEQQAYHADLEKVMRAYIHEHQSKFIPEGVDISTMKEERQSVLERSSAVTTLAMKHLTVAQWQAVSSRMHSILLKKGLYKVLLSQTGDQAQSLLNLLHQLLDLPDVAPQTRLSFLTALVRLSKKTALYPECLVLTGLDKVGEHPVAAGSFGEVWQGVLREREVSIKVIKVYLRDDAEKLLKAFYNEAILWSQLGHPNILPLYGIYFLDDIRSRLCLVSPWMHHGNLSQYIKNVPDANYATLLLDIARGLEYLHQNKIAHGDLKGANILVTPSARACIMDFGLSTIADPHILNWTSLASSSGRGGSVRWQAPELLSGDTQGSFAGDIYAYACVCYEIFSGTHPFSEFTIDSTVILKVISGIRPNRPLSNLLSEQMWQLMQHCWLAEPTQRPNTEEVVTRISTFPEGMDVEPARNEWDELFPRLLRESLRGETVSLTLEELRVMFPSADGED